MAEAGPLLGIDPRYGHPSEWLTCSSISSARYAGAWPVINGKVYLQEGREEHLEVLLTCVCGRAPDHLIEPVSYSHYEYDWDHGVFVEKTRLGKRPAHQVGAAGASVGLGIAASCFARPATFGYAGFLRGTKIMD